VERLSEKRCGGRWETIQEKETIGEPSDRREIKEREPELDGEGVKAGKKGNLGESGCPEKDQKQGISLKKKEGRSHQRKHKDYFTIDSEIRGPASQEKGRPQCRGPRTADGSAG